MSEITAVEAWEVLDSRGNPTVRVAVETGTARGVFTVPAGASTGSFEAVEVRDGDERYGGMGVTTAVENITTEIRPEVMGRDVFAQRAVDETLVDLDGTETLSELGANATLGVSGAVARAASNHAEIPLYEYLAPDTPGRSPLPMVNILSGGLHAQGGIEIQDFLVVPTGAETYSEALETVWSVRRSVRDRILERGDRPLVADEGGFSPSVDSIDEAFELLVDGIRDAGRSPGRDGVAIGVDVAATHFQDPETGQYRLESMERTLDTDEMIDQVIAWTESYPVISIEDPLSEDEWDAWRRLSERLDAGIQLLGDDFLVTDRERLVRADETGAANAVLVKPNQAGTISRTVDVIEEAVSRGVSPVVSARSGETCDPTIADLAVGFDAGQIKIGSLCRSERLAKYNRLLYVEKEIGGRISERGHAAFG